MSGLEIAHDLSSEAPEALTWEGFSEVVGRIVSGVEAFDVYNPQMEALLHFA